MGAAGSIHLEVVKSVEVSFVDKKSGRFLSDDEITKISNEACKEFDYHPSFYDAYNVGKDGKSPYAKYAANLAAGLVR
jgi:hypothetical protein